MPVPGHGARALKGTLFTPVPGTINVHKQLGKGNNYREISGKFGVVASTAYEKVNTTGIDEGLPGVWGAGEHGQFQLGNRGTKAKYLREQGNKKTF